MRRIVVVAIVVAMLMSPLLTVTSCTATDDLPKTKIYFEEDKVSVYVNLNTKPIGTNTEIEFLDRISIVPVNDNLIVTMNGEPVITGDSFALQRKYFDDAIIIEAYIVGTILFEFVGEGHDTSPPEKIENSAIKGEIILPSYSFDDISLKEWYAIKDEMKYVFPSGAVKANMDFLNLFSDDSVLTLYGEWKYNEYDVILKDYEGTIDDELWSNVGEEYHLQYTVLSNDVILPHVEDHWYDFISWLNEDEEQVDVVASSTCKDVTLHANQKLKEFNVNYYYKEDSEEPFEVKKLTKKYFDTPTISEDNFAGWFYKNQDNNECEFKEGVVLQNDMNVYAKYYEKSNGGSGSNTGFYSILTNNGIKITDNEVIETVVASTVFVMLALATFVFVFKRH